MKKKIPKTLLFAFPVIFIISLQLTLYRKYSEHTIYQNSSDNSSISRYKLRRSYTFYLQFFSGREKTSYWMNWSTQNSLQQSSRKNASKVKNFEMVWKTSQPSSASSPWRQTSGCRDPSRRLGPGRQRRSIMSSTSWTDLQMQHL